MKILKYSILLLIFVILSCHKDDFSTDISMVNPDPKLNLWKTVYGQVTNQKGDPIPNAQIKYKSKSYTTDQNGYFSFQDFISTERSIIRIEHPIYFTSYLQFKAFPKGDIPVSIRLNNLYGKQSYPSETAFSIQDASGLKLDFVANAISNADSSAYKGNVLVAQRYVNPNYQAEEVNIPTDFIGINDKLEITGLLTFGIAQLSLKDPANRSLIISKPCKIQIPILPGMSQFAESQLHFWNLDVGKGIWIKKELAVMNGNTYEGTITGSENWMVAKEIPVSKITGQIKSIQPLPLLKIDFNELSTINNRTTYSDNAGNFEIYLPNSINYSENIFNSLHEILYTNQLPAISMPVNLPEIDLQNNNCFAVQYKITACDGMDPISNWLIVREIGSINDEILYPGFKNEINQIIKVHENGSYILFPSIGSEQYFNYGQPLLQSSHTSNSFNTIKVCDNPGGQSLLLLDKNDPSNTLSHFLPYNNVIFDQTSPNNGIIHLSWTDLYDQNTSIEYKIVRPANPA